MRLKFILWSAINDTEMMMMIEAHVSLSNLQDTHYGNMFVHEK